LREQLLVIDSRAISVSISGSVTVAIVHAAGRFLDTHHRGDDPDGRVDSR
jgi:hypothetical protein